MQTHVCELIDDKERWKRERGRRRDRERKRMIERERGIERKEERQGVF